jgi:hypothetical protein
MNGLAALASGAVFAVGLVVGGMTRPSRIVGFLDLFGNWDPTLAFVMAGAVGTHFGMLRWILRRPSPVLAPRFVLPTRKDVDLPLLIGAVLFGAGWGLGGYCPGPAVVSLAAGNPNTWVFVGAMLLGMLLFTVYDRLNVRQPLAKWVPRTNRRAAIARTGRPRT